MTTHKFKEDFNVDYNNFMIYKFYLKYDKDFGINAIRSSIFILNFSKLFLKREYNINDNKKFKGHSMNKSNWYNPTRPVSSFDRVEKAENPCIGYDTLNSVIPLTLCKAFCLSHSR